MDYACQFIGNPYVWGGTSLTNGADCSGFVQSVYKHFGVNLPRTSGAMRGSGKGVSYSDAIPGDIVCYSGHVGIYMGNGKIVNAINSSKGIGVLSATYANIVTVRRVLKKYILTAAPPASLPGFSCAKKQIYKLYKSVKKCKNRKWRLIQVIHTEILKKGGKIDALWNLSTLST